MTARGRAAAAQHLAYIERDGVNQDGSKGDLYGPEGFDRERFVGELPGEKRQFRFIVSPEDAAELDLRAFTRALMTQMEADLGRRLVWGAVEHWNTDNPHAHIVVRGLDASGDDLTIDPRYMGSGLRWRAQEIVTNELGLRPEGALERQWEEEVGRDRFTSIDRQLVPLLDPEGRLSLERAARLTVALPVVMGRLETLEKLQLARRDDANQWVLSPEWTVALQAMGERNDVIKRLHREVGRGGRYRLVDAGQAVPSFKGIVRRKGLHDEHTGEMFAIVETVGGVAEYIRLPQGTAVREGAIVRVSSEAERWVRSSDRALQELADRNHGVYDPGAQLAALQQRHRLPGQPTPAELVAGNERRLTRLARYRLVERLKDGRWRIPPTLVQDLEAREKTHPRRKLRVQEIAPSLRVQVGREESTWLDRQELPPAAAAGTRVRFREELRAALMERGRVLRARAAAPALEDASLERERLVVGRDVAAAHKVRLAVEQPERLSGRVVACEERAGRYYVAILDRDRSLVVVPVPRPVTNLVGRNVTAFRGNDSRFEVAVGDLSRGE